MMAFAIVDRTGMRFTYNPLNLPIAASGNGLTVAYLYDAAGNKLKKTSSTVGTRDDIGGIAYNNTVIDRIATSEGSAFNSGGSFVYQYNLTDHLGNVRATIKKNSSGAVEVIQQDVTIHLENSEDC